MASKVAFVTHLVKSKTIWWLGSARSKSFHLLVSYWRMIFNQKIKQIGFSITIAAEALNIGTCSLDSLEPKAGFIILRWRLWIFPVQRCCDVNVNGWEMKCVYHQPRVTHDRKAFSILHDVPFALKNCSQRCDKYTEALSDLRSTACPPRLVSEEVIWRGVLNWHQRDLWIWWYLRKRPAIWSRSRRYEHEKWGPTTLLTSPARLWKYWRRLPRRRGSTHR